jgi:hypothetical protein
VTLNSYQPISSVCTLSKLFELVLKRLVMKHVEDSELLEITNDSDLDLADPAKQR